MPFWLIALVVVFGIAVIFWGFSNTLNGRADPLLTHFSRHVPAARPFVPAETPPAPPPAEEAASDPAEEPATATEVRP